MEQPHIDGLLERYLGLLDEYTQLRKSLSQLQSGVYQNIARANFSGERGMRYGQDQYDQRMQATRLITIGVDEEELPGFAVVDALVEESVKEEPDTAKGSTEGPEQQDDNDSSEKATLKKPKNPLHWFGLFAPMPLRAAQTQSVQAVEEIIPRLASVNAEMVSVEIEVRRARKRRAKAEAAAKKESESIIDTEPQSAALEVS
ncbi:hypothetical protein FZEAL_815 [Fusarium zealandicum]|uniref:Vacuolar ATPase assembly protein VMA22 n=1 Tax=Fusarium zealandicum TaxID=1053134 RepID=A0A8H4XQJ0_9HYPO|nr:hypothetical protein FZEAL_815 [Fusarium zealandicum]